MTEDLIIPRRIVLTGGPCAGKTTAKNYLQEKLGDYGWDLTFVPEVATFIFGSGINPMKLTQEQMLPLQNLLFSTQLMLEDSTFRLAMELKNSKNPLMVCDRGCMDGVAYTTKEMFETILANHRMTEVDARDRRYGAVFHLVTAADGRPEFYTKENNPERFETAEQAVLADQRTRNAWLGHPHLRIIDNSTLFDLKMKRLLNEIRRFLGIPVALEIEKKFLVQGGVVLRNIPVPFKKILIEQVYLDSKDGGEMRLRRRSQEDCSSVYYQTHKTPTESETVRVEAERQITSQDYEYKLRYARTDCDIIRKTRVCFLWQNQYFELDVITEPQRLLGTTLLEIELTEENDKIYIPSWLGMVDEVTSQKEYKNFNLAKRP